MQAPLACAPAPAPGGWAAQPRQQRGKPRRPPPPRGASRSSCSGAVTSGPSRGRAPAHPTLTTHAGSAARLPPVDEPPASPHCQRSLHLGTQLGAERSISQVAKRFMGTGTGPRPPETPDTAPHGPVGSPVAPADPPGPDPSEPAAVAAAAAAAAITLLPWSLSWVRWGGRRDPRPSPDLRLTAWRGGAARAPANRERRGRGLSPRRPSRVEGRGYSRRHSQSKRWGRL